MSELDARMEALAEAVVFAHEPDAPDLRVDDADVRAFEHTAALAAAGLVRWTEAPAGLRARLAADGLQFCAERNQPLRPQVASTPSSRAASVLPFLLGLAAGILGLLLLTAREDEPVPPAGRRAALMAADAHAVQWHWQPGPSPLRGDVRGDVVWSSARQEGYLTLHGLPALDAEHRFQLWIVDGTRTGDPVDGGLFAIVDAAAETVVPVQAKLPIGQPAAFVVTVEPKAGVVVSKQEHVVAIAGM